MNKILIKSQQQKKITLTGSKLAQGIHNLLIWRSLTTAIFLVKDFANEPVEWVE